MKTGAALNGGVRVCEFHVLSGSGIHIGMFKFAMNTIQAAFVTTRSDFNETR